MACENERRRICELAVEARDGDGSEEGAEKVHDRVGCGGGGGGAPAGLERETAFGNVHMAHLELRWRLRIEPDQS